MTCFWLTCDLRCQKTDYTAADTADLLILLVATATVTAASTNTTDSDTSNAPAIPTATIFVKNPQKRFFLYIDGSQMKKSEFQNHGVVKNYLNVRYKKNIRQFFEKNTKTTNFYIKFLRMTQLFVQKLKNPQRQTPENPGTIQPTNRATS